MPSAYCYSVRLYGTMTRAVCPGRSQTLDQAMQICLDRLPTQGARMILVSDRLANEHAKNPGSFRPAGL